MAWNEILILIGLVFAIIVVVNLANYRHWNLAEFKVWIALIGLAVAFFSGLYSLFSMIASIIHFQILLAIGFFILTAIAYGAFMKIGLWVHENN